MPSNPLQIEFERQRTELWNKWDFFTREAKPPILMRFPHDPKKVEEYLISCQQESVKKIVEMIKQDIGLMRQWLNEDRITDKKMVTNEELLVWFRNILSELNKAI